MNTMRDELQRHVKKHPRGYAKTLKKYTTLYQWVLNQTKQYADFNLRERIYITLHPYESLYCEYGSRKFLYRMNYGLKCKQTCQCVKDKALKQRKKTNQKRYGSEFPAQSDVVKEKMATTNTKKYGSISPAGSKKVRDKMKRTMVERYGVKNAAYLDSSIEKKKQTMLNRYGCQNPNQIHIDPVCLSIFSNSEKLTNYMNNTGIQQASLELGVSYSALRKRMIEFGICDKFQSYGEVELQLFLDSLNEQYTTNTRKIISPLELDIYIPDHNLAIEFCGLYWHSEQYKPQSYHQKKWETCRDQGIQLITIFSDEWLSKKKICQSRLSYLLKKSNKGPGARSLSIRFISSKESRAFLDLYHIQRSAPAKFHYGAFNRDELVAVMTFSSPRRATSQKSGSELTRFSTNGKNYPGIASKMFKQFTNDHQPTIITSFCDLRWGTGNLYRQLGFEYQYTTKPNYWYFNDEYIRYHRYNFTKHTILEKYGGDPNLTEIENMAKIGYNRIFDCGNSKWTWRN